MDKPREFWVCRDKLGEKYWTYHSNSSSINVLTNDSVHVIEKSAYDKLEAENKDLLASHPGNLKEYLRLKASNKALSEALEEILIAGTFSEDRDAAINNSKITNWDEASARYLYLLGRNHNDDFIEHTLKTHGHKGG